MAGTEKAKTATSAEMIEKIHRTVLEDRRNFERTGTSGAATDYYRTKSNRKTRSDQCLELPQCITTIFAADPQEEMNRG